MSKFSFLNNLSQEQLKKVEESKKTQYQVYSIELGFEKFNVCIPITESVAFDAEINAMKDINNYTIKKVVAKFNGFIQD